MSNLLFDRGAKRLSGRQALVWSPTGHSGTSREQVLRVPLQDVTPAIDPGVVGVRESVDFSTREVFTAGTVHEIEATLRFNAHAENLIQMAMDAARGDTLTFYPDVSNAGKSYDVELVDVSGDRMARLSEVRGIFREYDLTIRFRKADGSAFGPEIFTGMLFSYRAGWDLSRATFSRASDATYDDISATLQTASSGVARDAHYVTDEDGNLVRAIKLEASRTNSLTRSEEFDHADWSKLDVSVTADDTTAPDGTATADLIEDTAAGNSGFIRQQVSVADDSLDRVYSVFLRKNTGGDVLLMTLAYLSGTTELDYKLYVDPGDGSFSAEGDLSGGTQGTDFDVEDVTDDWWRIWVKGANNGTGNTAIRTPILPSIRASGDVGGTDDASLTGSNHFWGAQLEGVSGGASSPSSYIPTTSSTVTRSADDNTFTYNPAPQELTEYGKAVVWGVPSSGTLTLAYIGGTQGASDAWLAVEVDSSGQIVVTHDNGSSEVSSTAATSVSVGDVVEWRAVLNSDGSVLAGASVNGAAEVTGSTSSANALASSWSASTFEPNAQNGSTIGFNDFIAVKIAPGVKTMDEMRALAGEG